MRYERIHVVVANDYKEADGTRHTAIQLCGRENDRPVSFMTIWFLNGQMDSFNGIARLERRWRAAERLALIYLNRSIPWQAHVQRNEPYCDTTKEDTEREANQTRLYS